LKRRTLDVNGTDFGRSESFNERFSGCARLPASKAARSLNGGTVMETNFGPGVESRLQVKVTEADEFGSAVRNDVCPRLKGA
jgi:hypothetical protein